MKINYQIVAAIILFIILGTIQHTLNNILLHLKDIKNILTGINTKDR
ncbi:hypothetical protein SAMN02745945_01074 [Peptoclostridium litorale DSM 5388]|uniref:Uncharacterized protein n=1 Tax=Peptoclostridium litorale DSM 5388 TaxID=1121324 RepID=A0A069RAM2_PEPLI|nr:hypothetical protein [Peptoclostridium litorale]KDR93878.1 hypothetical protein CLIT_23c01500 [Peptoclostridium litorale DSM 5388]KDR95305.1 hypothetical protein CLIT_10c00320 [Peptoclostridium litorale DSM 5388]SIN87724.1 hypothetical protein SAMN02745945_01074 [Peptoclostridium litorale DSM 5388]